MKIPSAPPEFVDTYTTLLNRLAKLDAEVSMAAREAMVAIGPTDVKNRYLHWDDFRFRSPHAPLTLAESWSLTKLSRKRIATPTPFADETGVPFTFVQTDHLSKCLHEIDSETRGGIQFSGVVPSEQDAKRYLIKSLIEEPFNSSVLEGAATTRDEAKRLIRQNTPPRTIGEKMVVNNYHAIEFIKSQRDELLTPAIICELHRIITEGTLDKPDKAGAFRSKDDDINVVDDTNNTILHTPPPAELLDNRIQTICDFANGQVAADKFVHPILRAMILHFMLAYDHPFVDGNGRTARALFYWSALKDGYWLLEYVSISRIINTAPAKYGMAFLYTETDENDLTYFLIHQIDVLTQAIDDLGKFIKNKQTEIAQLGTVLRSEQLRRDLNHRQLSLLNDAVHAPEMIYKISDYQKLHAISYLTARKDLERLASLDFLTKQKRGNTSFYRPAPRLAGKLSARSVHK